MPDSPAEASVPSHFVDLEGVLAWRRVQPESLSEAAVLGIRLPRDYRMHARFDRIFVLERAHRPSDQDSTAWSLSVDPRDVGKGSDSSRV